jgi:CheY-like chemotaxis protein
VKTLTAIPPSDVRILIVEDDVYFQRILQKRLEADGYQIATAADGREGMQRIVTWDPHLVVSDWMMPHVDGLELCQSVKTGLKELAPYFILLTAKGEINDRLLGLDTGADDYLIKPCDQGEILARIRAGLRSILLSRELARTIGELEKANAALAKAHAELAAGGGRSESARLCRCVECRRVGQGDGPWGTPDQALAWLPEGRCPECEANAVHGGPDVRFAA